MEPLYNKQAEEGLLATLVIHNDLIGPVSGRVRPEDLFDDNHRLIYGGILTAYQQFKRADAVTVYDTIRTGAPDIKLTREQLAAVLEFAEQADDPWPYAEVIRAHAERRRLVLECDRVKLAITDGKTLEEVGALAQAIRLRSIKEDVRDVVQCSGEAMVCLDRIRTGGVDLSTGLAEIDFCIGGLRRGLLYTIGGKTSQGKTSIALNIALNNLANNPRCKVLYNCFENLDQVAIRLASLDRGVPLDWFLKPNLVKPEEYADVQLALDGLAKYKDRMLVTPRLSVNQMRAVCDEYKPDIVVVDYLQRFAHVGNLSKEGRLSHEIGKACSDIQDMALDKQCAAVILSQFSRRSEDQRGRAPVIEDLKESGDIENYSDVILLLYWAWRDTLNPHKNAKDYSILVRKNKLGPCMDFSVCINPQTLRISDWGKA